MQYTSVLVESRVDWLTVTSTTPRKVGNLESLGRELVKKCEADGDQPQPWHWRQYSGQHCGPVTYGIREDSDILQLAGPLADEWFDTVYAMADKVTRIDLCVTVRYEPEKEGVASGIYKQGVEWSDKRGTGPGFTLITNSRGGSTAYIGARISDLYGRVYDKWRESQDDRYRGCWRWEVEIKGDPAGRAAAALHASGNRPGRCASTVHRFFSRRGCQPEWDSDSEPVHLVNIRPRPDIRRKLNWLDTQVRGTVGWLCDRGYESAVIEALGLDISQDERARRRGLFRGNRHFDQLQGDSGEQ